MESVGAQLRAGALALIAVALGACPAEDTGPPAALGDCPPESTVVWSDVQPIFGTYCTHCHSTTLEGDDRNGAPEDVNLDTIDGAQPDWLVWQMVWTGQMPEDRVIVPEEDKWLIYEWLSCGRPE